MSGNGISAMTVNFQLIVSAIVKMTKPPVEMESTNVKIPIPAVC